MTEVSIRRIHRYVGMAVAPLILVQAVSGLFLALDGLSRLRRWVQAFVDGRDLPSVAQFLDFILVDVHYGGGTVATALQVALVVGLVGLVVTGAYVFAKVEGRLRRAARVETPAEPTPAPAGEEPSPVRGLAAVAVDGDPEEGEIPPMGDRTLVALAWVSAAAVVGLTAALFYGTYQVGSLHVPLVQAAMEIRLEVTRGHLWVEEVLGGDRQASLDEVWADLDRAERAAEAMLLGSPGDGDRFAPLTETRLRERIEAVRSELQELRRLTQERIGEVDAGPGTPLDQLYDEVFERLSSAAQEVESELRAAIRRDRERSLALFAALASAAGLLAVALGVIVHRLRAKLRDRVREAEAARSKAEQGEALLTQVVQKAADLLLVLDSSGRILDANEMACKALGYPRADLLGLSLPDIEAVCSLDELQGVWRRMIPGSPVSMRCAYRRRDGSAFPVEVDMGVLEWGDRRLVLCLSRERAA